MIGKAADRSRVQDRALCLLQERQKRRRHIHRRLRIRAKDALPRRIVNLVDRPRHEDARIVEEDVEPSELLPHNSEKPRHIVGIRHICTDEAYMPRMFLLHLSGKRLAALRISAHGDDVRSLGGEEPRRRMADARGRARDERDLSREPPHHSPSFPCHS